MNKEEYNNQRRKKSEEANFYETRKEPLQNSIEKLEKAASEC